MKSTWLISLNVRSWLTGAHHRWVKMFDLKMRERKRHVCLLVNNFSAHDLAFEPTNVTIHFFAPNLTSFIQPLDAGIIRCFKAHYQQSFCHWAINLDDAGERDIYNINLLEGMLMAKKAWKSVTQETMENCWNHTAIQHAPISPILLRIPNPTATAAWDIIQQFASTDMTLPQAESALQTHFGDKYDDKAWRPALDAVLAAENDVGIALEAVKELRSASGQETITKSPTVVPARAKTRQCQELEQDIVESIKELQMRNRIFGTAPTLDEFIEPPAEKDHGDQTHQFDGDDEIVAQVHYEEAVKRGEVIEVDSDEEVDENEGVSMTDVEMISLCERLEKASLTSAAECSLDVVTVLRRFRAQLSKIGFEKAKQTKLTSFWAPQTTSSTSAGTA